jgi:short-subunit dehydrogenase
MQLKDARILVTGAAGGIGQATVLELARRGARVLATDRDEAPLCALAAAAPAGAVRTRVADLSRLDQLPALMDAAAAELSGLDVLVNNAGVLDFAPLDQERPADIELTFRVNVLAPVLLSRAALPHLRPSRGRILNVGSIFGSIAFPWFATYSASKFAIRGFSEALRRELHGSGVGVTYVAPRATRTPLATLFGRMAEATAMPMDPPERVAVAIARALERDAADVYLGGPEPFFVRLNGLLPRLVDRALRQQGDAMRPFAVEAAQARPATAAPSASPAPSGTSAPCAT